MPAERRPAAADVGAGECWPTVTQELLLRAALADGDAALDAWREWRARVDVEDLDNASQRLLPLLFRNLGRLGVAHPDLARYRSVYRKVWYRNQMLRAELARVLRMLADAGVPTLVLKGAAMIALYYGDVGARAMDDVDVLVPPARARDAIESLLAAGWSTSFPTVTSRVLLTHSMLFERGGYDLDLHWHVMEECCLPEADVASWRDAVAVDFGGADSLALSPGDQLLHAIVHGVRWEPSPPIRWVADAATVIARAGTRIDWPAVADAAVQRGVTLPLLHGLSYLRRLLGSPVPARVLDRLASEPIPRWQVAEFRVKSLRRTAWRRLRFHWFNYRRLRQVVDSDLPHGGFLGYLQGRWGVATPWALPGFVIAESWRRRSRGGA
jgi:hypothetical protein